MAYLDVDTITKTARTGGDLRGRIEIGLLKKAALRATAIADIADQRERTIVRTILDGATPTSWLTIILELLDIATQLTNPTDAQIDTQINSGWAYILGSR